MHKNWLAGVLLSACLVANAHATSAATPDSKFPLSTPAASTTEPAQQYSVGQDWLWRTRLLPALDDIRKRPSYDGAAQLNGLRPASPFR